MLMQTLHDNMHVRKKSNFIITTGKKGAGKSWTCLGFGQNLVGESFGMNHVCFSTPQLFDKLDAGVFSPGDVAILEEIGIAANSRDAMSRTNKHLSFLAQAIRPARITLMANTISWGLIDNQVKNLADYRMNVLGHDVIERTTKFKFFAISPNEFGGEPMKSHLQFNGVKYTSWTLSAPTNELGTVYDKARDEYIKQIYSDGSATFTTNKDVRFGNKKEKVIKKTDEEIASEGLSIYPKLVDEVGRLKTSKIMANLKINGASRAAKIKELIMNRYNGLSI